MLSVGDMDKNRVFGVSTVVPGIRLTFDETVQYVTEDSVLAGPWKSPFFIKLEFISPSTVFSLTEFFDSSSVSYFPETAPYIFLPSEEQEYTLIARPYVSNI